MGIQEFGVAAYVKNFAAGKLDAHAQLGRFVGYDLESKEYRIYWPNKWSVSVERNVVFNKDDTLTNQNFATIPGDSLAEGEKEKVIQSSADSNHTKVPDESSNQSENQENAEAAPDFEPQNSIPFPSSSKRQEKQSKIQQTMSNPNMVEVSAQESLKERIKP